MIGRRRKSRSELGITLVELVVSIVIVGAAASGVLLVFHQTVSRSADPMVLHQAVAIGEAYMEEILLKQFSDPDQPESGGPEAGETRPTYDDVNDYDGLTNVGALDQDNNPIAGLGAYTISVAVGNQLLNGVPAVDSLRVDVQVTGPNAVNVTLSGYRTNF